MYVKESQRLSLIDMHLTIVNTQIDKRMHVYSVTTLPQ